MKIVKINSENGLLSAGDLPGMTVVFLCAFFVITHFFKKGSKMEKIKHNRFSKVLVLLMAVMMVLTMMPNGMWGGVLKPHGLIQHQRLSITQQRLLI